MIILAEILIFYMVAMLAAIKQATTLYRVVAYFWSD